VRRIIIVSILAFCLACEQGVYFEQSFLIPEGQWNYEEVAQFDFVVDSPETYFDLVLEVEHSPEYTYENTYVKIHTLFPDGEEVTDEVSLQLADGLDQWEGQCNSSSCNVTILLQEKVRFADAGKHQIRIEQYNRENPLTGIHQLRLKIIEVDE